MWPKYRHCVYSRSQIFLKWDGDGRGCCRTSLVLFSGLSLRDTFRSIMTKILIRLLLLLWTTSLISMYGAFLLISTPRMLQQTWSEAKLQSLPRALNRKDLKLSRAIMEHAKLMLQSGDESFLAGPGFVCIMKEAELMYQLLQCKFDSTNLISFSNQIRRSAFNLMMYNVDKSTAVPAVAAMVGLAREAKIARYVLAQEDCEHYLDYDVCDTIREGTNKVLTKLEREFACDTAGHSGVLGASTTHKSEEPEARAVTKDEEFAGEPLQSSEPLK